VSRRRAPQSLDQFCLLELRHAAVPAGGPG
jgi:hypothetical protein